MNKNIATKEFIEEKVLDLVNTFPLNGDMFWVILIQRFLYHECSVQELNKSIEYAIDFIDKDHLKVADIIQPILDSRTLHFVY